MKPFPATIPLVLAAGAAFAGTWNPDRTAADARWMLHLDLSGLRATTTGKGLVERLEEKKGRQFRALKRMFSVNPLTDLDSVTLYGPGVDDQGVVLIEGRFDRAHIEDVIGGADDYARHSHAGFTVHEWTDKDKRQFGSFAADDRIVFSEHRGLLHHALDVLAGTADPADAAPFLKAGPAPAVAAGFAQLNEIEMDGEDSKLLRKAESLQIAVAEDDGRLVARLAIGAADAETAEQLRRVLDGIAAFAELAEIVGDEVGFKARTSDKDKSVEVTCSLPVDRFLALVDEHGILDEKEGTDED